MKFLTAAASGDLYFSAARPAILCLVVGRKHFEFGYGVNVKGDMLGAVRSRIDVCRSIDRQIVLPGAVAVDIEAAEAAGPGHLPVNRAYGLRNKFHQVEVVSAIDRNLLQLAPGYQVGLLAALFLDGKLGGSSNHFHCV